jgi:hypothetical protein
VQPLLWWKSNKYYILWVCVCSLNYPACNAHAPYYIAIRDAGGGGLYQKFPHYLINGTIFGKMLLNTKCVFWFYLKLLSETFLILRRIQRDIIINVYWSWGKAPSILVRLQWNFLRMFFEKIHKRYTKKTSSTSQILPCGQTDLTKLTIAFLNFTNATKKLVKVNEEIKAINKCWWAHRMSEEKKAPRFKQSALLISKNKTTYRTMCHDMSLCSIYVRTDSLCNGASLFSLHHQNKTGNSTVDPSGRSA